MKKYITFITLFFSLASFSQFLGSLQTTTKKLYQANYLMDFETIVSLSYPKIAEIMGKDVMLEKLEKQYENEEYRLRYQLETVPFQMGAIKKIGGKSFCIINCRNPLRFFFEAKLSSQAAIEKTKMLQELNKSKDVTFEPKRNSFNVRKITTFVAVLDETTYAEWRFFNLDDVNQYQIFQSLFDENVKTALGL